MYDSHLCAACHGGHSERKGIRGKSRNLNSPGIQERGIEQRKSLTQCT